MGTESDWMLDDEAAGWILCDGSVYLDSTYPELAALAPLIPSDPAPVGSFTVPTRADVTYGDTTVKVKIKAE